MAKMATVLKKSATIFVVKNVPESATYFRDALGFQIEFLYGEPPNYAGVCRDDVAVHLGRSCPPSKARTIDRPNEFRIRGWSDLATL